MKDHRHSILILLVFTTPLFPRFANQPFAAETPNQTPRAAESSAQSRLKFYERRPAIIQRTDDEQLRALFDAGLTIDPVRPKTLEAYVTEEEFSWVERRGWQIDWVPDEELPYWTETKIATDSLPTPLAFYPTYEQIAADLQILAASFPSLCTVESIGQSVLGRDLWFLKITDNPTLEENEPEFKYISTMHGNETVGVPMLLNLVHLLLETYETDPRIRGLVDETEIWIMPLMNPDGYSTNPRSRFNANGEDLNRDFPDPLRQSPTDLVPQEQRPDREVETLAVIDFGTASSSVLSANLHTGVQVVNYAWDHQLPATPDDDVFVHVSRTYADLNMSMLNNPRADPSFNNGIVRGALWFIIYGGMQDWNYRDLGSNEVTLELSNTKSPSESTLLSFWEDNRESLLAYMEQVHIGAHGLVTDSVTGQPLAATIRVVGRDHEVFTDPDVGDYQRMLLPGTYDLVVSAQGYEPVTADAVTVHEGTATVLDMALQPESEPISIWILR